MISRLRHSKLLASLFLALLMVCGQAPTHAQQQGVPNQPTSIGTGFVVASGYVLTALHVVLNNDLILVGPTAEKKWLKAELIKSDLASDLALLAVGIDLPPANRTMAMAVSPQILENCGYEDHTIYR